jgi:type I restriction enzyme S subunit
MSKDKLMPEIRFPEFKEGEEWVVKKLGLLTNTTIGEFVIKTRQDPNSPYPVYNGGKSYTGFYDEYNNEANKIVISARGANAGFVNLVKQKYWAGNSCYSVEVLEKNAINLELLFYYIKHNQRRFTDNQQAANIPSVSKSDVEKFKICYPEDILEQQKIASCLSALDEVIAANSQKLDLLKGHKKGLMQNLFPQEGEKVPKCRFKEFENDGEWVKTKLGDSAIFINGRAYKQEELLESGKYRVLRVGNFFTNKNWYYSDLELEEDKYCEDGDLLYAWSASFGPRVWRGEKVIYHYHIWKVLPAESISNDFLFVLLDKETEQMKTQNANGFALLHITKGTIESWECSIPKSKVEQQKIASCLSSLDALITAQAERIEQLKLHKEGLMQGLFPKIND